MALERDGYHIVQSVLDLKTVEDARADLLALFADPAHERPGDISDHPRIGSVRFDVLNRHPRFAALFLQPALVSELRRFLGNDFVLLPESAAHDRGYGDWHKDTTSQERAGLAFHQAPDFRMLQVAIYLQDNGDQGGGLDVVPGSHLRPDRHLGALDKTVLDKIATKAKGLLLPARRGTRVDSRAGDVVLFDMRLDHKATARGKASVGRVRKLALFVIAAKNDAHARSYVAYVGTRSDYVYLKNYRTSVALRALCERAGVGLLA